MSKEQQERRPTLDALIPVNGDPEEAGLDDTPGTPLLSPVSDSDPGKSTLLTVCSFIIVCEFCERLAYYGMAGSLVLLFQTDLNLTNADADSQYSLWSGVCYVTPLLGGWIADSYLGRYRSIMLFSSVYVVGLVLLVVGTIPGDVSSAVIFSAIYIIALGTGGIKPNVSTFGAEQFDVRRPRDRKELDSFFNWFYWSINLGALISYTLVAPICQYGLKGLGGLEWRFVVGFSIPAIAMGLAILTFVSGTQRYKMRPHEGSVLSKALQILGQATARLCSSEPLPANSTWLDRAKAINGGSFDIADVEGVKYVWRLLPYLLLTVPYWAVYNQMSTAFQNQGCQMTLKLGSVNMPVSTLNLFDTLAILLLIPVFDGLVYPFFKSRGRPLTMLQKIGWGFVFAILSMVVAGVVEHYRKEMAPPEMTYLEYAMDNNTEFAQSHITACKQIDDFNPFKFQDWYAHASGASKPAYCSQSCDTMGPDGKLDLSCITCDDVPLVSSMNVMWQVPQFMLVGMSEILASVTGLEFFFSQAPKSMRSFTAALNLFATSLGSWMCIPIIYLVNIDKTNQWLPADVNQGYMMYYFFLLAGIQLVDLLIFIWVASGYQYKNLEEEEEQPSTGAQSTEASMRIHHRAMSELHE
jgi:solute carrier family 15 (peptide/histidine transporter), member 3/4